MNLRDRKRVSVITVLNTDLQRAWKKRIRRRIVRLRKINVLAVSHVIALSALPKLK